MRAFELVTLNDLKWCNGCYFALFYLVIIMIVRYSRYRSWICQPCDIAELRVRTISCMNARLTHALIADWHRPNSQHQLHERI